MARIILKQSYSFTAPNGTKTPFYFDPAPQDVPDWVTASPEFALLKKSQHVEVIEAPVILPAFPITPTPQPDPEAMAAHENRQVNAHVDASTPPKAGEEAVLTEEEEEEAYRKSSGIDGPSGDWTKSGIDKSGFPVGKGSPEDTTATDADKAAYVVAQLAKGK